MMTADVFLIADSRFHDCRLQIYFDCRLQIYFDCRLQIYFDCRLQIYFDCRLKISGLQTADVGVPRNIRLQILNLKIAPV